MRSHTTDSQNLALIAAAPRPAPDGRGEPERASQQFPKQRFGPGTAGDIAVDLLSQAQAQWPDSYHRN